jgi:hypothetical protein
MFRSFFMAIFRGSSTVLCAVMGFYTYKNVFNILLVLNVKESVFQSVNSA